MTRSSNFFSTNVSSENTAKYTCTSLVILFLVLLRHRTSSQRNNNLQRSFVRTRTAFYEGQLAKSMNLKTKQCCIDHFAILLSRLRFSDLNRLMKPELEDAKYHNVSEN